MWNKIELPQGLTKFQKEKLHAYVGQSTTDMNLVGQYERAVNFLISQIVEKGERVDTIAHPLLYLMRHSIELALKENIRYLNKYSKLGIEKRKTHSINDLFDEFKRHFTKISTDLNISEELSTEYNKYAAEFDLLISKLGKDCNSFRYVKNTSGKKIFNHSDILDTYDLKQKYENAMIFLTHTVDAISPYTDFVDLIENDKSIKEKGIGKVLFTLPSYSKKIILEKLNEDYKVIIKDKLWVNKEGNQNITLNEFNGNCYVYPFKKKKRPTKCDIF